MLYTSLKYLKYKKSSLFPENSKEGTLLMTKIKKKLFLENRSNNFVQISYMETIFKYLKCKNLH